MSLKKKVCIVSTDVMGVIPNGGVGTAVGELCFILDQSIYDIELLYCYFLGVNDVCFDWWQAYYLQRGIKLVSVPNTDLFIENHSKFAQISYCAYQYLKDKDFDTILFQEMHGIGYYSLLAKQSGLNFLNTNLFIMYHGPTCWHIENNNGSIMSHEEIYLDFLEKESLKRADRVIFSTEYARKSALKGNFIQENTPYEIILYPFNTKDFAKNKKYTKINSLVFFGRLESRKGLPEFLNYLTLLKEELKRRKIKVHLVGKYGLINGEYSEGFLNSWQEKNNFKIEIKSNLDRNDALKYINQLNPIVAITSKEETLGYTLIESVASNLSVMCNNLPVFNEVLTKLGSEKVTRFNLEGNDFVQKFKDLVESPNQPGVNEKKINQIIKDWNQLLQSKPKKTEINPFRGLISICIIGAQENINTHKENLETTIDQNCELLLANKNNPLSEELTKIANSANGDYLVFIDENSTLNNLSIAQLRTSLGQTNSDINVWPEIHEDAKISISSYALPLGQHLSINLFWNLICNRSFCFKKSSFLKVNGLKSNNFEYYIFELMLKAIDQGQSYHVIPENLVRRNIEISEKLNFNKINTQKMALKEIISKYVDQRLYLNLNLMQTNYIEQFVHNKKRSHPINPKRANLSTAHITKNIHSFLKENFENKFSRLNNFAFLKVKVSSKLAPNRKKNKSKLQKIILFIKCNGDFTLSIEGENNSIKVNRNILMLVLNKPKTKKISIYSVDKECELLILGYKLVG